VGIVLLIIPIGIMVAVLAWALPARRKYKVALKSPLQDAKGSVAIGSAAAISDPGRVPWRDLLDALAVQPEGPYHEGWMGTMLGLQTKWSTSSTVLEPHRMWGVRHGHNVQIQLGPDEKVEGGTELYSNKHIRAIIDIEAVLPPFEVTGENGRLSAHGDVPPAVTEVLRGLQSSPEVWQKLTVTAGPTGIRSSRPSVGDVLNCWLYDLWLCERLAAALGA
jgi:hypothetical protein